MKGKYLIKLVIIVLMLLSMDVYAQNQKLYILMGPNGKYGFLDKNGKVVVDYQFDKIMPYQQDRAKVIINDLYGFVDKEGNIVIEVKYESASNFYKGRTKVFKDNQVAYLDKDGNLIHGWYDYLGNIQDNLALVVKDQKYAYINDYTGKPITDWYDYIEAFYQGKAMVGNDDKYFYIDKKGKFIDDAPDLL